MPFIGREAALARLRARIQAKEPIIGAGAGTGITAKFSERGGVDLIIIYNSGRYRMAGRGSLAGLLAYGDANAIVVEMAREVLPVVKNTPVLAGVNGTDPFRLMPVFLKELKQMGFDGVQNFPTVGLIDGMFRANLEETGMSYDLEVEMIAEARRLDMLTCAVHLQCGEREEDGEGGRGRPGHTRRPDDEGLDRRGDGADTRAGRGEGAGDAPMRRRRCAMM